VLFDLLFSLVRATFDNMTRLPDLLLLPVSPGMHPAALLFKPRGMEDFRPFLLGFLFNSLIYTALWLGGERVFRQWRARRPETGEPAAPGPTLR
jgi:hypothetical protein